MQKTYTFQLRTSVFLLLSLFVFSTASTQIIWDGGGDGTSWEDPANWNPDMVPPADSLVVFDVNATITGTAAVGPYRVNIAENAQVTLDLDLSVGNGVTNEHAVVISAHATLNLGTGTPRNFSLETTSGKQCMAIFAASDSAAIFIAPETTVQFVQGSNGLNLANAKSSVTNEGTLVFGSLIKNGIKTNGTFLNKGTIQFDEVITDGAQVREGVFENGPSGLITATKPGDDCFELFGNSVFTNYGALELVAQDSAGTGNNCIQVGTDVEQATFINESDGTVSANGGAKITGRPISLGELGVLQNYGAITVDGGNDGARIYSRGEMINEMNGVLDLLDGRVNVSAGILTNNGFVKSTRTDGPGIFNTGEVINNAFYQFDNSNLFASGTGIFTDNGIDLTDTTRTKIDAEGTCLVDIAETPYEWFEGGNSIGIADATGGLVFPEESLSADPAILTTSLEGVSIMVFNICPEAVVTSSVFVPKTETVLLHVYPTLAGPGEMLIVDLSGFAHEPITFEIMDMTGKVVRSFILQGGAESSIELGELRKGMYILKSYTNGVNATGRIIVFD